MTIPIVLGLILVRITIDGSQLLYRGYFRHQAMNISDIKSITFRHIYMSWSTIVINFQDNTTPAYAIWSHGFTYKQMENLFDALNVINPNISTQILNGSSKVLDYFKLK